jgi:transposase-like protein
METNFKSLIQLFDYFKDENTCKLFLMKQRWNGKPSCPHCGSAKMPYITNRGFKCSDKDCYKKFTVITGTIYENTKIPLRTWFAALYLITAHKKGISSLQLSRDLAITQKTSWFMLHRIREMLKNNTMERFTGIVEADETYMGGKTSNKHKWQRDIINKKGTGTTNKIPVVAVLSREGKVVTKVIEGFKALPALVNPFIREQVTPNSTLITDGLGTYRLLAGEYKHEVVNHKNDEYARGIFHTNTIEGYFSHLKRMIIGTYHSVSRKHLQAYCNEMSYRYSTREIKDTERFYACMAGMNIRLKYTDLIK